MLLLAKLLLLHSLPDGGIEFINGEGIIEHGVCPTLSDGWERAHEHRPTGFGCAFKARILPQFSAQLQPLIALLATAASHCRGD
jgi:hypothetical protein